MKAICIPTPIIFLLASLLAFTLPATATIRYVIAGATGAGTSWTDASGNLKTIIEASASGDEVWVAQGDYKTPNDQSFVMKPGVKIYGGFAGTETSVAQRNLSVYISRLLPYDDEAIIQNINNGLQNTALLDGFTIANATQTAVKNTRSSPSYNNCTFSNNKSSTEGGAMANDNSFSSITNCSFIGNQGNNGGAIASTVGSGVNITNCSFSLNVATGNGACILLSSSDAIITNCSFTDNTASTKGGGIYMTSVNATITGCTFSGNIAQSGGGLYIYFSAPTITNCIFKGNKVNTTGGAITNDGAQPTYINCVMSGNFANSAGAAISNRNNATTTLINCTISGNQSVIVTSVIYSATFSATTLKNTIIYNNSGGISNVGSSTSTVSYSLIQGLTATSNGNISGAGNPLFVNPVAPGLNTGGDYRLQPCSPVINKGNNSFITTLTDLDGNARFNFNGIVDMGAYERAAPTIAANGGIIYVKEGSTGTGSSWDCATNDLQAAINAAISGNQIWVAGGTYIPNRRSDATGTITTGDRNNAFVLKNDVKIYGGFAGTETTLASRNLALTANTSILSGDLNSNDIGFTNNSENALHVVISSGNNSSTLLDGFIIQGGNCDNSGGAGISCNNNGSPAFNNLIVKGNAGRYGAGFNISSSSPTITNSIVTGNAGFYGGGILGSDCGAILTNVLISGNTAVEQGGGMYNEWSVAPVLTNVTIAGNTTTYGEGGAMYNHLGPALQLRNSIVYGNSSGIYNNAGTPTIQFSLVQGETSTANGNIAGTVSPSFVNQPAAGLNTGGDYTLQVCSPAINAGSNTFFANGQSPDLQGITTELNSANRNQGIAIDMGVYEYTGNPGGAGLLGINGDVTTNTILGNTNFIANSSCRLITTLQPTGSTNALTGSVNTNVWIESAQPANYVKRHYQVNPAGNASNATGRATLYFTQAEFDAFNAVNTAKLPTGPTDINGKRMLIIRKYAGISNDGTGLPNTYSAGSTTINPNDNDIVWNATTSRWEVSFDFTGYSGFFITSDLDILPLTLLNFTGRHYNEYNQLQWETTDEVNVKHFILESSTDGNTYSPIATIAAGSNAYSYKDNISFNGKMYYRLKMVDNDGKFTYSTTVTLTSNSGGAVSIYPNPANDKVYISTGNEMLQHSVRLYDISGQLLQTIQINNSLQTLPVQHLKSGLYLLQFDNGTTVKFVKQ